METKMAKAKSEVLQKINTGIMKTDILIQKLEDEEKSDESKNESVLENKEVEEIKIEPEIKETPQIDSNQNPANEQLCKIDGRSLSSALGLIDDQKTSFKNMNLPKFWAKINQLDKEIELKQISSLRENKPEKQLTEKQSSEHKREDSVMSWINNSNNEIEKFINENEEFLKEDKDNPGCNDNPNNKDNPDDEDNQPKRLTTEEINIIFE